MTNLVETPQWEPGIYQLETLDPVEGGPNGIDNLQAKQLGNRTQFLKALIEAAQNSLAGHESATDPHPQYLTTAEGNSMIASAVSALVNSSPATLDTLNELAAALGNDPNFATSMATALGNKQPIDATLTAIAALTTAANKLIYATGADTFGTTDITSFARTLLDDSDAATARSTLLINSGLAVGIGTNGYIKLPDWLGGFLIQWGTLASSNSSDTNVAFPMAFPSGCKSLVLSAVASPSQGVIATIGSYGITATNFAAGAWTSNSSRSAATAVEWIAIGY